MSSNKGQNIFKSFAWAFAMLAFMIIFSIARTPSLLSFLIGGTIFVLGCLYETKLYIADDEETLAPWGLMAVGAILYVLLTNA